MLVVADVIGGLVFERGLQDPLGQLLDQPTLAWVRNVRSACQQVGRLRPGCRRRGYVRRGAGRQLAIAWAGNIAAYGSTARWFGTLTDSPTATPSATVRSGPININHIDRPYIQVAIAGKDAAYVKPSAIHNAIVGVRPDQAVKGIQQLMAPANILVVRLRASTPRVAAQGNSPATPSTLPALPAAPHKDRLRGQPDGNPVDDQRNHRR